MFDNYWEHLPQEDKIRPPAALELVAWFQHSTPAAPPAIWLEPGSAKRAAVSTLRRVLVINYGYFILHSQMSAADQETAT